MKRFDRALRNAARHWAAFRDPKGGEHPLDVAVAGVPEVERLRKRLRRANVRLGRAVADRETFIEQQDAEMAYRSVREEIFFGVGYQLGLDGGRKRRRS
jgi:hypothetical protein